MFTGQVNPLPGWRGGDGNAAYLDKTLRFRGIEEQLNESVGPGVVFALFARGLVLSVLVYLVGTVLGLFLFIVGGTAAFGMWLFMTLVAIVVFWVVILFARLPEPIAEWRVLLAERHGRRDQAYLGVRRVLQARGFPLAVGEEQGRLVLRERTYVAYISVFTYGSSLYLGWMMWRSRRGYQLLGQFLGDLWLSLQAKNQIEHQILRSEGARAMREAVHLACREGLMVALEQSDPQPYADPPPQVTGGYPGPPPQAPYTTGQFPSMPVQPPPPGPNGPQSGGWTS
ncbi:hypothetical protein ACYF6T_36320 [Streptomyces sp. 7R007]